MSDSLNDRFRRVKDLALAGGSGALAALEGALKDPSISVQIEAAKGLGRLRSQEAVPALLRYLRVCDLAAVEDVARALADSGLREAPEELLALLSDPDHARRYAAAVCLGALGHAGALSYLCRATGDRTGMVRRGACRALGELGDRRAAPTLVFAARDPDPLVRREAAKGLGELDAGGEALRRLARDPDWKVRREALEALARVLGRRAIPALEEALGDAEDRVRETACGVLAELGEVEPIIEVLLRDPSPGVRRRAAQALGRSGDARAAQPLLHSLAREGFELRAYALAALGQVMGERLEGFLADALAAPEAGVRRAAINALAEAGARCYAHEIAALLEDPENGVRFAAVSALGELRVPAALTPLGLLLCEDAHPGLRSAAAHAISRIPGGRPILERAARHPSPAVREEALAALTSRERPDGDRRP